MGDLITARLQENRMKAKGDFSVELCWKSNPILIRINYVLDHTISKMYNTPIRGPDFSFWAQRQVAFHHREGNLEGHIAGPGIRPSW